jgi:superfamily II DNA or RNA helicase
MHAELGATTRYNTKVLCVECHRAEHKKQRTRLFSSSGWDSLRQWQRDAIDRFIELEDENQFVLEAAPGAGKSRFAAFISQYAITELGLDHVVFIAPWLPILTSVKRNFDPLGLTPRDKFHYDKKRGILQRKPNVDVTLDTYSGFCNQTTIDVIDEWQRESSAGWRFMLILDEIHHTNTIKGKWGPYVERIANMATKLVVMSGTFFRSDSRPISFLEYHNDRPKTHYSITFSECVRNRFTRQVSFRFHNPVIEFAKQNEEKVIRKKLENIPTAASKMLTKAKEEVLRPDFIHVEAMISEAWKELQAMRRKWSDAACLVVCRPGTGADEERQVHAVEAKIKSLTGCTPTVVTSDDSLSRGKLDAFDKSHDPFLCAIRMVSEGVDIPRIRMVLFLSYTDSEMLFRQIVGRCCRYIDGKEDDTAALVILPKFRVMADFAERFESESKQGLLNMEPQKDSNPQTDGSVEFECKQCGNNPCTCFTVVESYIGEGGGMISASSVAEEFVQRAKLIRDSSPAHQHANAVQLGDALQRSANMGSLVLSNIEDQRAMAFRHIDSKVKKIARLVYGGDIGAAWRKEVHERTGSDMDEIRGTWRTEDIIKLNDQLRNRLAEVARNA